MDGSEDLDNLLDDLLGDELESNGDLEAEQFSVSVDQPCSSHHEALNKTSIILNEEFKPINVNLEEQGTPCDETSALSPDNLQSRMMLAIPHVAHEDDREEELAAMHLLQLAEEQEASLRQSPSGSQVSLADELHSLVASSDDEWHPRGRPNASGSSTIGSSVLLELRELPSSPSPSSSSSSSSSPSSSSASSYLQGMSDLQGAWARAGRPKVVACGGARRGGVVAVGTDSGALVVFQTTSPLLPPPSHPPSPAHPCLKASEFLTQTWAPGQEAQNSEGRVRNLIVLGQGLALSGGRQEVSALGFSTILPLTSPLPTSGPPPPFWVLAGHASGTITAWDLNLAHRVNADPYRGNNQAAQQSANLLKTPSLSITGQHSHPVTHVSFLPGRGIAQALSVDSSGKLIHHTLAVPSASSTLVITTKPTTLSKVLLDQDFGVISSIAHFSPSTSSTEGKSSTDGLIGDGLIAVCSSTGVFVCHIGLNGDFSLLYSIPDPSTSSPSANMIQGQPSCPSADWLPAPPFKPHGHQSPPHAVLAVSWQDSVKVHSIPLLDRLSISLCRDRASQSSSSKDAKAPPPPPPANASATPPTSFYKAMAAVAASASATASSAAANSFSFGSMGQGAAAAAASLLSLPASTAHAIHAATGATVSLPYDPVTFHDIIQELAVKHPLPSPSCEWKNDELAKDLGIEGALKIVGVVWLNAHSLAVVTTSGVSSHIVSLRANLNESKDRVIDWLFEDQVEVMDLPSQSKHHIGAASWSGSIAGCKNQILVMGSNGLALCKLMTWQERLFVPLALGKWRLGIKLGLDVLHRRPTMEHLDPSLFVSELVQWLICFLLGLVSSTIAQEGSDLSSAAKTAVALCLQLDRSIKSAKVQADATIPPLTTLYTSIFEAFNQSSSKKDLPDLIDFSDEPAERPPLASKDRPPPLSFLMDAIEDKVLRGLINVLPPEIMQALVLHLSSSASTGVEGSTTSAASSLRMERCIVKLDVLSMDLNQVIRLCESAGLYSGLISVYNRLGEFKSPAAFLLVAAAHHSHHPRSLSDGTKLILKLLVYLQCVFDGKAFPPTSSQPPHSLHTSPASDPRCQLMGLLLLSDVSDLVREAGGSKQAPPVLQDPYPGLHLMLMIAPRPTLLVLDAAFKAWDAVETDLRAALSMKQDDEMKSVSVASQLLVDALVTLVDTHRLAEASGQEETVHAEEGRGAEGAAMTLILKLVASGRTCVPSPVALKLLSLVLARSSSPASPIPAGQTPRAANMDRLMSGIEGSIPDLAWCSGSSQGEFEAIKLLRSFQYSSMAEEVNQGGAMEASLSWKESSVAAMMCSEAGMHRAACLVHHIRGDYASAVDSLLSLPPSSSCSRQHPASQYLSMHLSQDGASSFSSPLLSGSGTVRSSLTAAKRLREVVPRMIEALSTRMVDLLAMDPLPTLASKLILDHLPQSSHLSLALQGGQGSSHVTGKASHCSRDVRFAFLSAARVLAADERTSGESSTVAQDSPARDYPTWGPASPLMNNAEVAETFLSLLCQYTPHEALPYLISLFSSSTAAPDAIQADGRANVWDVQKLLACCRASKVPDAEAFLLEKLGEDEEACRLWLSHVKASFDLPSTLAHPQDKAELMDKLQLIVRAVSSAVEFCGRHLRSHKHLEPNTNIEAAYWLRLLDVILNKKHGDAENNLSGGDELEALMRVRSIMAEEVVERVSALIPPASVARSLALHYASGKFGELKRPMTRIFEACAHEQRLVGSTHRLIGGDAFATFLQLKATRTKSSSGAQGPKGSGHGMQLPCQSEVANGVLQRPFKNPQGFHLLDKTLQESRKPDGIRATILIDHRGTSASLDNNGPVGNTPEGREQEEEQGLFDVDEILAWAKAV